MKIGNATALVMTVILSAGCAHNVSEDYSEYLESNTGAFRFAQTGYEAQYYVTQEVRDHTIQFSSGMAGPGNIWNVNFGTILVDTLESDDYQAAFISLSETTEPVLEKGILFKYEKVRYSYIGNRAHISLRIIVIRDGQQILARTYQEVGSSQMAQTALGGVFLMSNAVHNSTKWALDRLLANSLSNFQAALKNPIIVQETVAGPSVAEVLAALKTQHEQGLLTDEEYMQKQRQVIDEHTKRTRETLQDYALPY